MSSEKKGIFLKEPKKLNLNDISLTVRCRPGSCLLVQLALQRDRFSFVMKASTAGAVESNTGFLSWCESRIRVFPLAFLFRTRSDFRTSSGHSAAAGVLGFCFGFAFAFAFAFSFAFRFPPNRFSVLERAWPARAVADPGLHRRR